MTLDEKIKFCFEVYDLDGDETISKAEFLSVYLRTNSNMSREDGRTKVDEIFERVRGV